MANICWTFATFPHGVKGTVTPEMFMPGVPREAKPQTEDQIFRNFMAAFASCGYEVHDSRPKT